jgi:hypothetical protein
MNSGKKKDMKRAKQVAIQTSSVDFNRKAAKKYFVKYAMKFL